MYRQLIAATLFFFLLLPALARQTEGEKTEETAEQTAEQAGKPEDEDKPNPYFERLAPSDRTAMRRFEQAKRLIDAQRLAEAAQLLGAILEGPVDFFIAPPFDTPADIPISDRTTGKLFGDLVLETLLGFPAKARESYALQYETQANRLLEKAVREGSVEGVQFVAKRYFPTSAGAEATFLLGVDQMDRGAYEAAALTFQRLNRTRMDLARFEPAFGLSLAVCQLRLDRRDEARKTIDTLFQRVRSPEILLFGREPWKPQSTDEILARLEKQLETAPPISMAAWLERTGWRLNAGTPSQNPETEAQKPLLELLWGVPTLHKTVFQREARALLLAVRKELKNNSSALIPAARPLVVADRILARGFSELMAIDARTGKLLWTATEPEYRIANSVQSSHQRNALQQFRGGGTDASMALRLHFWHDRISHQLSSDGCRLFSIDGHDPRAITFLGWGRAGGNLRIGRKTTEDLRNGPGSTLTARDVETGRILWQAGKFPYVQKYFDRFLEDYEEEEKRKKAEAAAKDKENKEAPKPEADQARRPDRDFSEEERFLGETWFLGAPLPLEGRLYVLGENGGLLRLIVLDAETGKLIRQVPIATPPASLETDPIRKFFALAPSAAGGILLCPTGLGMVVALDATTAAPLWCFSYLEPPKEETGDGRNRRNLRNLPFQMGGNVLSGNLTGTGWRVPSIMIDGHRALVASPDDPALYCLETTTGKLLWKNDRIKREHALYTACIRNGKAYVVTTAGMAALDMETGKLVWDLVPSVGKTAELQDGDEPLQLLAFPSGLKPTGVGVHNGESYFLPLSEDRLGIVDLDRARLELMSSGSNAVTTESDPTEALEPTVDVDVENVDQFQSAFEERLLTWMSPPDETGSAGLSLGNLVGIRGRFFSQSPLRISCFDQFEILRRRAETLLEANREDPEGLLLLGRIRRYEGKRAEAVELFRRAGKAGGGGDKAECASDYLRKTLLDAFRNDYAAWKSCTGELESLAGFPEEYGEILYVMARGSLGDGDGEAFLDTLRKAFALEIDHSIQVPVDAEHRTQLHRALGFFVRELVDRKDPDAPEREQLERLAETIFQGLHEKKDIAVFLSKPRQNDADPAKYRLFGYRLVRPWWEEDATPLSSEARRWRIFTDLFHSMPVADRAEKILDEYYERNRLFVALEQQINPPVDWPLSDKLSDVILRGNTETASVEEAMTLKPAPNAPTSPPYLPSKPASPDDLKRLATYILSHGNAADALYYYRYYLRVAQKTFGNQDEEFWKTVSENPEIRNRLQRDRDAATWPNGQVALEDENRPKTGPDTQNPRGASIASILRGVRRSGPFPANRRSLSLLGSFEPFLSPYAYCLETAQNDVHLVCSDSLGVEQWRSPVSEIASNMSEYGYFAENHSGSGAIDQTVYLKGCNHLLVFVRDHELIAYDTFRLEPGEAPRVLWTKTVSSKLPCRQAYSALPLGNLQAYAMQPTRGFPHDSLFVSPRVVCYRDAEQVYGLDPLSGQVLWSRSMPSSHCTILGDRENLFLIFPDVHQAVAVDPGTGRELASGTIPQGGYFAFGTNIVFVRQIETTGSQVRPYQLHVADLRELFQKRRRALLVSSENVSGGIPSLPTYPIREELTHEAMVRPFHHGRFLASISWTMKTLQIYDLETKRSILGPPDELGHRTGAKLPEPALRDSRRRHDGDFDVELLDDKFLVYFVEKGDVNTQMKSEVNESGTPVRRRRNAVSNVPVRNFGRGCLMLYDTDGKECWPAPVRIEDWYRLLRAPEGLPVTLFVVSVTEQIGRAGQNNLYTGLWGIDKRTGQTRFRCLVPPLPPNLSQTMLQGFRVQADPVKKEIAFIIPNRTVLAKFTEDKAEPKKPAEEKPGPNIFERMFDWFGN